MAGKKKLQTRNIALDTQFIVSQNFLKGELLQTISSHAKEGIISIFITDIVYRETLVRFKEALIEAKSKNLPERLSKLYVLRNFKKFDSYFSLPEIQIQELTQEFRLQFDAWIKSHHVGIVDTTTIKVGSILDDYFERRPPFEHGKKHEFPDAISLMGLNEYFTSIKEYSYLVSGDEGVNKTTHSQLIHEKNAGELIELILLEKEYNSTRIEFIRKKLLALTPSIQENCEQVLYTAAKADILNAYTINGQLIGGIETLKVTLWLTSEYDIIYLNENTFQVIAISDSQFTGEVSLLPLNYSGKNTEHALSQSKSNSSYDFNLSRPVDFLIYGNYDYQKQTIELWEYTVAPYEDLDIIKLTNIE